MSEFLEYEAGDGEQRKQDCETKAFHRLAERIKQAFPRLSILLLLDTGPWLYLQEMEMRLGRPFRLRLV